MPYLVVKPRLTLPSKIPVKPLPSQISTQPSVPLAPERHVSHWHALPIVVSQLTYALIAMAAGFTAYSYLEAFPVYRFVAMAIIGIVWSTVAGKTALKKSIDMLATVRVQAIRRQNIAITDNTNVFLKSVKSSFLEKSNEIR